MAEMSFDLTGIEQITAALRELGDRAPQQLAQALRLEAEAIMTDSKEHYVPVAPDGGTLRRSGMVGPVETSGNEVSITMGYGGEASAYALAAHEHLSEHSPPSWVKAGTIHWSEPGSGPKYLEIPFLKATKDMASRIADRLRGMFSGRSASAGSTPPGEGSL